MKIVRKVEDRFRIEDGRTMFVFAIHATSQTNCVEQVVRSSRLKILLFLFSNQGIRFYSLLSVNQTLFLKFEIVRLKKNGDQRRFRIQNICWHVSCSIDMFKIPQLSVVKLKLYKTLVGKASFR